MVKKGVARRKGGTNVLACKLRGPPVTQSRPGKARHISRGGALSSLSSRNRLTVSVFYYYFKPFALFFPLANPLPPPSSPSTLCPSRSPVSSPRSLPYHLCTTTPPYTIRVPMLSFPLFGSPRHSHRRISIYPPLSFTLALVPSTTTVDLTLLLLAASVSCLQAEMKISRLLAIETELLFHEVVDPFRHPLRPTPLSLSLSISLSLSLSPSPFALGPELHTESPCYHAPFSHFSLFPLSFSFFSSISPPRQD